MEVLIEFHLRNLASTCYVFLPSKANTTIGLLLVPAYCRLSIMCNVAVQLLIVQSKGIRVRNQEKKHFGYRINQINTVKVK